RQRAGLLRPAAQHRHGDPAQGNLDAARSRAVRRRPAQAVAWRRDPGMETCMNKNQRVMLLIDADNVSPDVVEQAVERVKAEHGAIHVRRAYCTVEKAGECLKLFKRLSIRPIVNISTGKNSTDIAMAVDAMDLVIAERPETVVIVSSDSDFAPLVLRLREKGCREQGIGQEGKTGEE